MRNLLGVPVTEAELWLVIGIGAFAMVVMLLNIYSDIQRGRGDRYFAEARAAMARGDVAAARGLAAEAAQRWSITTGKHRDDRAPADDLERLEIWEGIVAILLAGESSDECRSTVKAALTASQQYRMHLAQPDSRERARAQLKLLLAHRRTLKSLRRMLRRKT